MLQRHTPKPGTPPAGSDTVQVNVEDAKIQCIVSGNQQRTWWLVLQGNKADQSLMFPNTVSVSNSLPDDNGWKSRAGFDNPVQCSN